MGNIAQYVQSYKKAMKQTMELKELNGKTKQNRGWPNKDANTSKLFSCANMIKN